MFTKRVEEGSICGYTHKPCIKHSCRFWQQYQGENPQTGKSEDKWECATVIMPLLQIEVARQTYATAGAMESNRNVLSEKFDSLIGAVEQVQPKLEAEKSRVNSLEVIGD